MPAGMNLLHFERKALHAGLVMHSSRSSMLEIYGGHFAERLNE
jgi:hypothetical protein